LLRRAQRVLQAKLPAAPESPSAALRQVSSDSRRCYFEFLRGYLYAPETSTRLLELDRPAQRKAAKKRTLHDLAKPKDPAKAIAAAEAKARRPASAKGHGEVLGSRRLEPPTPTFSSTDGWKDFLQTRARLAKADRMVALTQASSRAGNLRTLSRQVQEREMRALVHSRQGFGCDVSKMDARAMRTFQRRQLRKAKSDSTQRWKLHASKHMELFREQRAVQMGDDPPASPSGGLEGAKGILEALKSVEIVSAKFEDAPVEGPGVSALSALDVGPGVEEDEEVVPDKLAPGAAFRVLVQQAETAEAAEAKAKQKATMKRSRTMGQLPPADEAGPLSPASKDEAKRRGSESAKKLGGRSSTGGRPPPLADAWTKVFQEQAARRRREKTAREVLRAAFFGKAPSQDAAEPEPCGTPRSVIQVWECWRDMDTSGDNEVELAEFSEWLQQQIAGEEDSFVRRRYQVGHRAVMQLLHAAPPFGVESLLRILWPQAGPGEITAMFAFIKRHESTRRQIKTPELLPAAKRDEIVEYYRLCAGGGSLRPDGLGVFQISSSEGEELFKYYERFLDADGSMSERGFLELMCPFGYRACVDSVVATAADGEELVFETDQFRGWRRAKEPGVAW